MEAVYPAAASALARGRRGRGRRAGPPARYRTVPVTFAEIKEVDEESECACAASGGARRRPDVLAGAAPPATTAPLAADTHAPDPLAAQLAEFRRRRQRRDVIREPPDEATGSGGQAGAAGVPRAAGPPEPAPRGASLCPPAETEPT